MSSFIQIWVNGTDIYSVTFPQVAVRIISSVHNMNHITSLPKILQCVSIAHGIKSQLLVVAYEDLHNMASANLFISSYAFLFTPWAASNSK